MLSRWMRDYLTFYVFAMVDYFLWHNLKPKGKIRSYEEEEADLIQNWKEV